MNGRRETVYLVLLALCLKSPASAVAQSSDDATFSSGTVPTDAGGQPVSGSSNHIVLEAWKLHGHQPMSSAHAAARIGCIVTCNVCGMTADVSPVLQVFAHEGWMLTSEDAYLWWV